MKLNVHFFWLEMGISHFDASNWVASPGFLIGFTSFVVSRKLYTFLLSFFFFDLNGTFISKRHPSRMLVAMN